MNEFTKVALVCLFILVVGLAAGYFATGLMLP